MAHDGPINFVDIIHPFYYYLMPSLNVYVNIFMTTTTLPTYLLATVSFEDIKHTFDL